MGRSAASRPTIFVIEDEWLLLDTITAELQDAGYGVIEAMSGDDALAILNATRKPDLLFTDIRLPGSVDGWQLAEAARAKYPHMPVIYATGYTAIPARQVPGSIFLQKPYRPSAVVQAATELGVPPPGEAQ